MMETSVMAAHDAIVGKAKRERKLAGMGTTVTAVALVAGYWVIAISAIRAPTCCATDA